MKRTNKCPKCGSSEVIADAKPIQPNPVGDDRILIATFRKPKAAVFKGQASTTLSAWVCADCGYVELYADAPNHIKIATA